MVLPLISPYLNWLQKGNPTGEVEPYPEIDADGQSSVPGLYIVGDLTGVPLLKLASESGARVVAALLADPDFQARRRPGGDRTSEGGMHDVVILGGGPAGIACALECGRQGLDYLVIESSRLFHTLENFPRRKPILAKPDGFAGKSPLRIEDGTKETLLEDLKRQLEDQPLKVRLGTRVERIRRRGEALVLESSQGSV